MDCQVNNIIKENVKTHEKNKDLAIEVTKQKRQIKEYQRGIRRIMHALGGSMDMDKKPHYTDDIYLEAISVIIDQITRMIDDNIYGRW